MNCKPGDLAIVVKSWAGNTGKVLTCIRLLTTAELEQEFWRTNLIWETDVLVRNTHGDYGYRCEDLVLRPIRDTPGEDETLIYAGLPGERVTA